MYNALTQFSDVISSVYIIIDHLFFRDVKPSGFLMELEKGKKTAQFILQKIPHIVPFAEVSIPKHTHLLVKM